MITRVVDTRGILVAIHTLQYICVRQFFARVFVEFARNVDYCFCFLEKRTHRGFDAADLLFGNKFFV
jgi:hypothetical protein